LQRNKIMNEKTIKEALLKGERVTLECKKAKSEVPKELWSTYSAFANTIGGLILLGVEEHRKETDPAKRFEIIGVDNHQKILTDFWNTINSNKVSLNILTDTDIEVVNLNGKQVLCIHVPQADWREKPIYLNENVYKGTYKRNHEGDYHCTESQVKAMIRDANDDGNDGLLMRHFGMDDIDEESLRQYRTEFRDENKDHPWNAYDDKKFLKSFGAYAMDKETGEEGLTLAGLLMFGTGLAVRERLSNFRMDYVDMSHLIGDERYHDRLTYDGRWENNMYQFLHRVVSKLTFDLPRPFKMNGIRRDDDTPQHKAVREAFANSIIHSDVFLSGGILRIDKYDDRLVFRNPGTLKLPIEQIYEGGISKARNPRIQNMLRMIGYGENLGSGFPLILSAWKETGWGKPELKNKIEVDEVELTLPVQSPIDKSNDETNENKWELPDVLKNVLKDVHKDTLKELTDRQIVILEKICTSPNVTQQEMSTKLKVSKKTIQREFDAIRKLGINIDRQDGRKKGEWVIKV
jgi:predicted HTH transcriptional regulator